VAEYAATCKRLRALIQRFASSSSTDVLRSYVTARSSNPHSKSDPVFDATVVIHASVHHNLRSDDYCLLRCDTV
jgi:hypothetical protein